MKTRRFDLRLFGLLAVAAATVSLLYVPNLVMGILPSSLVNNAFVDGKLKYQLLTLGLALLVLLVTYLLNPASFWRFFRLGRLNAPAQPIKWLGIEEGQTWGEIGRNFAIIISLATGAFVYFNVARGQSLAPDHARLLLWIPILAASNAFVEEMVTRFSVVSLLDGVLARPIIYLISALVFGIPHYFGVPGGPLGALMAAFLGWLLAKSIAETEGVFWAWFIHFLQDVIIFTALFLAAL